jgi:SAM-dependent MidA family methyltransferase
MSTVRQALQSALDKNGGMIPFDAFMGIALHHPQGGYYTRNVRTIGKRGDFTTIPQLTAELGTAIGRWIREEAGRRGWKRCNVIESGPGSGALASAVMKSFGLFGKRKVDLHLVETSQPLRAEQQKHLRGTWHTTLEEALAACEGRALIYHNEFLDAFPCRVFRREHEGWTELHLEVADGKLREIFLPPSRPLPASTVFTRAWPDSQRVEVFESVCEWMQSLGDLWTAGAMLAVDYGGTTDNIYHRRPGGTLRAYRAQQRLTDDSVYELPGRQDITADVNFDDLALWGRELIWETGQMTPLTEFAPDAPGADAFFSMTFTRL